MWLELLLGTRGTRRRDITILLVEQNASRALALADYGYVLESAELAVEGPADELREEQSGKRAHLGQ